MLILPLQYDRHSGPDAVGQHKLTFTIDESITQDSFNPMSIKKGTQYIAMLVEATSYEAKTFEQETPEQIRERFRKRMNALINKVAELKGEHPTEYRESVKDVLKQRGWITDSTNELSMENIAALIIELEKTRKHYDKTNSR